MKQINGITYYTKTEIQNMLGCSLALINKRISAAKIQGVYIAGHTKYYTSEQVTQIVEYRPKTESK